MKTPRRGFTLIEVLVVLTVLALVAALAYTLFDQVTQDAKKKQWATKVHNDLRTLAEGYELYRMKNGTLPAAVEYRGASLVSAGVLKALIPPPPRINDSTGNSILIGNYVYVPPTTRSVAGAAGVKEAYVAIRINEGVGDATQRLVAEIYNGNYTTYGTAYPVSTDTVGDNISAAILISSIWDWYIVWPIDVD